MEIIDKKGAESKVDTFEKLMVSLTWTSKADFDLLALIEEENSSDLNMVYFGNKGSLDSPPYIKLDQDAGVGDTVDNGGVNEENMAISKMDGHKKVHIACWDWGVLSSGGQARFKESDVKLKVTDDKGVSKEIHLDTGELGNVCVVATIEKTPDGLVLKNTSKIGLLKGKPSNSKDIANALGL